MVIPSEWECVGFHGIVWFKFIAFCCSYNLEDSTNNMRFVFYVFSPKSAILCHFWVLCRSRELTGHLFVINLINSVINCSKIITDSASQMCFFLLSCLNSGINIIFVFFMKQCIWWQHIDLQGTVKGVFTVLSFADQTTNCLIKR